jgi:hypothetical protein
MRAWTSPRIVGELRKLGIEIAKSTMEKYRARQRKLPSPTWKVLLNTHIKDSVTLDFFPVAKTTVAAGNFAGRTCEDGSIASELSSLDGAVERLNCLNILRCVIRRAWINHPQRYICTPSPITNTTVRPVIACVNRTIVFVALS